MAGHWAREERRALRVSWFIKYDVIFSACIKRD